MSESKYHNIPVKQDVWNRLETIKNRYPQLKDWNTFMIEVVGIIEDIENGTAKLVDVPVKQVATPVKQPSPSIANSPI
jgi:hypothetical protein